MPFSSVLIEATQLPTVDDIIMLILLYRSKGEEGMCPGSGSDSQLSILKPKHMVLVFLSKMQLCSAHFFLITVCLSLMMYKIPALLNDFAVFLHGSIPTPHPQLWIFFFWHSCHNMLFRPINTLFVMRSCVQISRHIQRATGIHVGVAATSELGTPSLLTVSSITSLAGWSPVTAPSLWQSCVFDSWPSFVFCEFLSLFFSFSS